LLAGHRPAKPCVRNSRRGYGDLIQVDPPSENRWRPYVRESVEWRPTTGRLDASGAVCATKIKGSRAVQRSFRHSTPTPFRLRCEGGGSAALIASRRDERIAAMPTSAAVSGHRSQTRDAVTNWKNTFAPRR